jgi:hypothetical protein
MGIVLDNTFYDFHHKATYLGQYPPFFFLTQHSERVALILMLV